MECYAGGKRLMPAVPLAKAHHGWWCQLGRLFPGCGRTVGRVLRREDFYDAAGLAYLYPGQCGELDGQPVPEHGAVERECRVVAGAVQFVRRLREHPAAALVGADSPDPPPLARGPLRQA